MLNFLNAQNQLRRELILVGDTILSAIAMPGFAAAEHLFPGELQVPLGVLVSMLGWPVAVPAMLVFGPPTYAYQSYFKVKELREDREAEERRMRRDG